MLKVVQEEATAKAIPPQVRVRQGLAHLRREEDMVEVTPHPRLPQSLPREAMVPVTPHPRLPQSPPREVMAPVTLEAPHLNHPRLTREDMVVLTQDYLTIVVLLDQILVVPTEATGNH